MKKIHPLVQKFFKSKLLHNVAYNWSKLGGGGIPLLISSPPSSAPATAISLLKQKNNTQIQIWLSVKGWNSPLIQTQTATGRDRGVFRLQNLSKCYVLFPMGIKV